LVINILKDIPKEICDPLGKVVANSIVGRGQIMISDDRDALELHESDVALQEDRLHYGGSDLRPEYEAQKHLMTAPNGPGISG
jgi:hypothetical protein